MRDPLEGVAADGTIVTGVARRRVPAEYEDVLGCALGAIADTTPDATVYLYGSVATGQARPGQSDVDLLTVGVDRATAAGLSEELSGRFRTICRGVELAPAGVHDSEGESEEAYGNKVFVRHYCVRLAGPEHAGLAAFPADVRAARGFNGDIEQRRQRWRQALACESVEPSELGRVVARKVLFATAGLVSMHDQTWTTDRARGARRWGEIRPEAAADLDTLLDWADGRSLAGSKALQRLLNTTVGEIVALFEARIGLWPTGWRGSPP